MHGQEAAGEAVVEDDDEEEEGADAPEPPPLTLPTPLEEALVDEELPSSECSRAACLATAVQPDGAFTAAVQDHVPVNEQVGTRQLWKLMLGTDSEVTSDFYKVRKYWDINIGQWTAKDVGPESAAPCSFDDAMLAIQACTARLSRACPAVTAEGKRVRQVEYTMPLKKNALGPSEAYNIEQYTVAAKEPGGWSVNIKVNTPKARSYSSLSLCGVQVPYGTAFHSNVQWACSHVSKGKCKLRVTGQVEFTKGCFVKGVITKATQEGMREAYATYMDVLRQKLGTAALVSAATVAQKVQDSHEGMHGRIGSLQILLSLALLLLVLLSWAVWRLDRRAQLHSQLLQSIANSSGDSLLKSEWATLSGGN
ncbi:hypothetical protein MMC29_003626 [Sticta canariensis]|nr:hypothetical protein [Sticta canariensis]